MTVHNPGPEDVELAVRWLEERWNDPSCYADRREYERALRVILMLRDKVELRPR